MTPSRTAHGPGAPSAFAGPCPTLMVDFAEVGHATRFDVPVSRREQADLSVGSVVHLLGDSVRPMLATVVAHHGRTAVEVELL